jgi:hypothetical protein
MIPPGGELLLVGSRRDDDCVPGLLAITKEALGRPD